MKTDLSMCICWLLCCAAVWAHTEFPAPYHAASYGKRLTPPDMPAPSINGAVVYGIRPGDQFVYRVPISGERPLRVEAEGLPTGVTLRDDGVITGSAERGEYHVQLRATNRHGHDEKVWILLVGDELCLTPPMGWNSWYSYSEAVSQKHVLNAARHLVESGLANHGWSYVNIDDCWQGKREKGVLQPNARFPDMQALCREIHALGLKAGIYSTPWMGTYAGYTGGSAPDARGDYSALALPLEQRLCAEQIFGRYPGVHRRKADCVGELWCFDRDAAQWAEWGFDYVKVDWSPNDVPTTKRIRHALDAAGRGMVLSLSNSAPIENAPALSRLACLWRTTGDIEDTWASISRIGFSQEPWQQFMSPGHWNDPDMLQVGRLGKPNSDEARFAPTRLTADEQYTQVTLWCILSAPLMISCDLEHIDSFTKGLLTNDEVLAVNQDPSAQAAHRLVCTDGSGEVWHKRLADGALAVAFFNTDKRRRVLRISLRELGVHTPCRVRDLWRRIDVGVVGEYMSVELDSHGAAFFRLH